MLDFKSAADSNLQEFDLLMGDFNRDWVEQSTQNFMKELLPGYKQLIHESTTDYSSILDHIYSNIPTELIQFVATESYDTDHKL